MTPEFALDLSPDGISLLRRADDGWRRVGAVSLDADRLAEDLAALRENAGGLLATKLVIPNSQILYKTCPASGKDALADEVRVRAALVGATPYEVSELLFDWESDGETLHIAVVARETLEEARDFAREYGFGPVGYVAVPPRGAFLREPFFGPVERGPGSGPAMQADAEPITVVGDWVAPEVSAPQEAVPEAEEVEAEDAAPEVVAEPKVPAEETLEAAAEGEAEAEETAELAEADDLREDDAPGNIFADDPEDEPIVAAEQNEAVVETPSEEEPEAVAADDAPEEAAVEAPEAVEAEVAPEEVAEVETVEAAPAPAEEDSEAVEVAATASEATVAAPVVSEETASAEESDAEEQPEAEEAPLPSFSSIRATASEGRAPKLGGARDEAAPATARKLGGARRGETPASPPEKKPTEAAKADATLSGVKPEALAASLEPAPSEPAPKPKAVADPEIAPQDASARSSAAFATFRDKVAAMRRPGERGALTPEIIAAPLPRPQPKDLPERISQEARDGEFTIFGARGKAKPKVGKGMPVALTLGLLLLLGMVGLWSKVFVANDGTGAGAPVQAEEVMASATGLPATADELTAARSITFGETGTSGATADPEGEAELADALQAPLENLAEADEPMDLASLSDDPFSALPEEEPELAEPMFENPPLPEIDADAASAEDEMADMEPEPELAAGERMSPEEAQAAYADTGVWQQSPVPAALPADESTDDIYIASIDPNVSPLDAVALPPAARGGGSDAALPRQPTPMPPGQVVEFDEDGRLRPTEDGLVTPEGVTLYAGRPGVVPRPRPGSAAAAAGEASVEEAAAEAEAETEGTAEADAALADKRPRARPEGIVEANEIAELGGRTRAELAGLRPRERPQSVQDTAEEARQAAIEEAVRNSAEESAELQQDEADARAQAELESASRLAVASSRTPARKPGGFEDKVASAREQAERDAADAARRAAEAAAQAVTAEARAAEEDAQEEEVRTASAATVLPRNQKVAPPVPSSASVAKAATDRNALKLRDINLIGVFGSPSQRRALVRLPSGRLVKVKAGDRLDGGQVAAIGQSELRYVKRGKNIVLSMPSG